MLYTFYGDDFTGSTDVLEQLASNGVPAVLFLAEPTAQHLARFPGVQAIGIAGDSRSRSPEWMSAHLPRIFSTLKAFHATISHYKVCSTFDSSPAFGSIGRAIEIGREVFHTDFVPIVVAAPHLGRYVRNGQLFAKAPDGQVRRIDQHPMANHPVTPMREPDLRRHLSAQTSLPIGHIDLATLTSSHLQDELNCQRESGSKTILFDGEDEPSLAVVGELIWSAAQQHPLFTAGSSGLTAALIHVWRRRNLIPRSPAQPVSSEGSSPLLVISGSCSPVTAGQIEHAVANGFCGIAIDAEKVLEPTTTATVQASTLSAASASLTAGQSTIIYTALGQPNATAHGSCLGEILGQLLHQLLRKANPQRIVLCGGDTSSHAIQQLGLYALTWIRNTQPGAPLCRAHSHDPMLDGREVILKGGQVGTPDFFKVASSV